jgi:peptidyl-dipeptidase A
MRIQTLLLVIAGLLVVSCSDTAQTEKLCRHFIHRHVERIKPIKHQLNEAAWATYTGQSSFQEFMKESKHSDSLYMAVNKGKEYYQRLLNNVYDNSTDFEMLVKIKKSGLLTDPVLKREFVRIFRDYIYIQNNWDKTEEKQVALFEKFYEMKRHENNFCDSLGSSDMMQVQSEWISSFAPLIDEFKEMIRALNADVKRMGYDNYFRLLMEYDDISYDDLDSFVERIDEATRNDYLLLLNRCKEQIGHENQLSTSNITPLHYRMAHGKMLIPDEWTTEFSQDEFIGHIANFYQTGGYDIAPIYAKSDMWYKPGKINNSFFFCVDHDNQDFRIYSNSKTDAASLVSMIHEFAHAIHYSCIGNDVPYLLKSPGSVTAEAVALYFDGKLYTSKTMQQAAGLASLDENPFFTEFRNPSRLFFIRKLLRNIQFEKSLYENPDQDFNQLWWELNKKYLLFDAQPENQLPEWLTSQHIIQLSGMNVTYLYAMAFAAQLEAYFPDSDIRAIEQKVMKWGDSKPWYELLQDATGETLNIKYLINSYRRNHLLTESIPVSVRSATDLGHKYMFISEELMSGVKHQRILNEFQNSI